MLIRLCVTGSPSMLLYSVYMELPRRRETSAEVLLVIAQPSRLFFASPTYVLPTHRIGLSDGYGTPIHASELCVSGRVMHELAVSADERGTHEPSARSEVL